MVILLKNCLASLKSIILMKWKNILNTSQNSISPQSYNHMQSLIWKDLKAFSKREEDQLKNLVHNSLQTKKKGVECLYHHNNINLNQLIKESLSI